ncbi:MAG: flavodoxin domain-containing protein [Defluviitaleaceae bacterium]|nr:flavodoxin domain-containing protein [Defluviitaleaceae bacterium]
MNNVAVIYKSKYGTTKQYAQWIAEALDAALLEASEIKPPQLMSYEVVVYGGGLYAGGIDGVKIVTKNPCKSLVVFTVGLADPNVTDYSVILKKNFTQEQLSATRIFHLRGGIDYNKLSIVHKGLMTLLRKMSLKKDVSELTDEDKLFLETYGAKLYFMDKDSIDPIVAFVKDQLSIN